MMEAFWLRADEVHAREEALREAVRELPDEDRRTYYRLLDKRIRDPDTYAVLNWLFMAGLHHFYVRNYLHGSINLGVMVVGIALLFSAPVLGAALLLLVLLAEVPALFRSQVIVQHFNTVEGERVLDEIARSGARRR